MSKIIKDETLPYKLEDAQKILNKADITFKTFANNRTLGEASFQLKAKVSYKLKADKDSTIVTIIWKNSGIGPIQKNAVQKQIDAFETALHSAVDDFEKDQNQSTGSSSIADELTKLSGLKESGILTEDEFNQQKAKLLNN